MHRTMLSMSLLLAACSLIAWSSTARTQQAVIPPDRDQREADSLTGFPFSGHRGRHQILISSSHLVPLGNPWSVSEVWFRRDMSLTRGGQPVGLIGGSTDLEIWASPTTSRADGPSAAFASNRGRGFGLVFSGTVTLPSVGPAPSAPAPWSPPYAISIPIRPAVSGGANENLLLELVIRETPGQPEPGFWIFDQERSSSPGLSVRFGRSCSSTAPFMDAATNSESLRPGSSTLFTLQSCPRYALALHLLGSSDVLLAGQAVLPLALDAAGAPGCALYTDPFFVTAHITDAPFRMRDGETRTDFHIPLSQDLHGLTFFSQWIVSEPGTNPLGLSTSNGVRLRLSSGSPSTGMAIVEAGDLTTRTGIVMTHLVPVMRLVR